MLMCGDMKVGCDYPLLLLGDTVLLGVSWNRGRNVLHEGLQTINRKAGGFDAGGDIHDYGLWETFKMTDPARGEY